MKKRSGSTPLLPPELAELSPPEPLVEPPSPKPPTAPVPPVPFGVSGGSWGRLSHAPRSIVLTTIENREELVGIMMRRGCYNRTPEGRSGEILLGKSHDAVDRRPVHVLVVHSQAAEGSG